MIKYLASDSWRPEIKAVECSRETDQSVFIGATRRAKVSHDAAYFDSFSEAKAWMMDRAEGRVTSARISLQRAQDNLGNIKGLKEPRA